LVYESERVFHGTPSGIDNTVVSYEQAIWFVRGQVGAQPISPTIEPLVLGRPFTILIADTGVRAPTHVPVGRVREQWLQEPHRFNQYFAEIGTLAAKVRMLLADGDERGLGAALDHNQELLHALGVSSPELERLIDAARAAGAFGAKLSGAGAGGIMLAVVDAAEGATVARALQEAGAQRIVQTTVG
jgi:mevalonate kinase